MKNLTVRDQRALVRAGMRLHAAWQNAPCGGCVEGRLGDAQHVWLLRAFQEALAPYRPIGVSIAVAHGGRVVDTFAWGEAVRGGAAVGEDTAFRVASLSKFVGTMAAMRLCEDGLLGLDDDVSRHLGFLLCNPRHAYVPITVRQLMTHTAGLRDEGDYNRTAGTEHMRPLETLFHHAADARRNFTNAAPGTVCRYSNLGAGMLGAVVEAVSGKDLDAYCRNVLFDPLGMDASFHPQRIRDKARLANCYRVPGGKLSYDAQAIAAQSLAEGPDPAMHYATLPGKLMISARDLMRLLLATLGDGSVDGVQLLLDASACEMRTLQDGRGSVKYAGRGLNLAMAQDVFAPGRLLVGHQGMAYGAVCEAWGDPKDGSAIVVLTNGADNKRIGPLARLGQAAVAAWYAFLKQQ